MPLEFAQNLSRFFRRDEKPMLADFSQPLLPEHSAEVQGNSEKQIIQPAVSEMPEFKTQEEMSDEQLAAEVQKVLDELLSEDNKGRMSAPESAIQQEKKTSLAPSKEESNEKKEMSALRWFSEQIAERQQREDRAKREYDAALREVRGELPEQSVLEDGQYLRRFEEEIGKRNAIGKDVVSRLQERFNSLTSEELAKLTDTTAEFVITEGQAWEEMMSLENRLKARFPEQEKEIEEHGEALEQEAETQKKMISIPEEWLDVQDPAELARVAGSPYSVENMLAKHSSLSEVGKARLKELLGITADNRLEENSLLGQALTLEEYQQRLNAQQADFLEKAKNNPGLADRLLLIAQRAFQVATQFQTVRMALDAVVREAETVSSTLIVKDETDSVGVSQEIQPEKAEEEEEEIPSAPISPSQEAPANPQMEAAQEELKRLERRKLELQKILESQWQSSGDVQESGSKSV